MSQFIGFNPTGPSGSGPVLSLTGNDGEVVVPTVGGTINVVGDNSTIITSKSGTNTMLIALGNTFVATLTTNDLAFHNLFIPGIALAGSGEAAQVTGTLVGAK